MGNPVLGNGKVNSARNLVAAGDSAENVDEKLFCAGGGEKNSHGVTDTVACGAAAEIQNLSLIHI